MTATDRTDSQELEPKRRALEMARRTLAILEMQAAAYTALTIPAHLQIDLEEQREKVAALEERLTESSRRLSLSEAIAGYQRDLKAACVSGNLTLEGTLLSQLSVAYTKPGDLRRTAEHTEAGDMRRATEYSDQAIAIARELGDRHAEAIRLQNLGLALLRLADAEPDQRRTHLSRAADALRQAMELFDALEVTPLQCARVRYHLGRCYHRLDRWREAITLLEQAREAFSRHKARPELAHALLELGRLHRLIQDFESAYIYLKDALRLFRRMKDTDGISVTQEALGNLALQTARPAEAIASLKEARRGYAALRRSKRVQAVDGLLHIAHQARQPVGGTAP